MRTLLSVVLSCFAITAFAEGCPTGFDEFLQEFQQSVAFQRAHSRFPLSYQYVDVSADPEPKTVEVQVASERAAEFPGIEYPSPARQSAVPLQRSISSPAADARVVLFRQTDGDAYQVEFVFARANGCWQLVQVKDASL